jgi:hypothetical protein
MKKLGTLDEFLKDMGFNFHGDIISSDREIIGFDKSYVTLEFA